MFKKVHRLGLFGLGAFGRLIVRHLSPYFDIYAHDPSPEARKFASRHNVTLVSLEEAAACPYVVLATPIRTLKALAEAIAPHVAPRALIIDVGSVKMKPARWLLDAMPADASILCTHPLFGPQSARKGIHDLEIVVCPVRVRHLASIIRFFEKTLDLKVSLATPEEHDRALAAVQGLTHLIAKVLSGLEPLPTVHTTRSYDLMMQGVGLVQGDSDELFLSIERDNPFASEVRKRFFAEIDSLRTRLEAHDSEK
ncbi:prephenate dehydrogenase/arogenate dehydrogenase family protein [Asticcacaulis sp. EMRT-3]|uniref:prephenate dehydrogenase/arogenate dehydrogenase family protein n=1 Tax=Asticcacaulis sp. EMRT-3 TaxID=3040349 RepID=UPI0024AF45E5|nr:prephenate dehydrogenase/arogenate dehydrogenase family protein [Asticcacaulis sp. EMRT-3]MDI7775315.1 prephenate dehydrogenase/arogenate dehydrogenase family protein [Asticcacaulis sp. EMRT-3]